jgi:hypothetical protein
LGEWRYSATILDLGKNGDEWSASRPSRFTPGEIPSGTRWAPEPVWTLWRTEESCLCRNSNQGRPASRYSNVKNILFGYFTMLSMAQTAFSASNGALLVKNELKRAVRATFEACSCICGTG